MEAVVRLLIEKGVDINAEDNNGQTPLSQATFMGHEAVVRLLKNHPDVWVRNLDSAPSDLVSQRMRKQLVWKAHTRNGRRQPWLGPQALDRLPKAQQPVWQARTRNGQRQPWLGPQALDRLPKARRLSSPLEIFAVRGRHMPAMSAPY